MSESKTTLWNKVVLRCPFCFAEVKFEAGTAHCTNCNAHEVDFTVKLNGDIEMVFERSSEILENQRKKV